MNTDISSFGWLEPLWIFGAPLLASVILYLSTPKNSNRDAYSGGAERTGVYGEIGVGPRLSGANGGESASLMRAAVGRGSEPPGTLNAEWTSPAGPLPLCGACC